MVAVVRPSICIFFVRRCFLFFSSPLLRVRIATPLNLGFLFLSVAWLETGPPSTLARLTIEKRADAICTQGSNHTNLIKSLFERQQSSLSVDA